MSSVMLSNKQTTRTLLFCKDIHTVHTVRNTQCSICHGAMCVDLDMSDSMTAHTLANEVLHVLVLVNRNCAAFG